MINYRENSDMRDIVIISKYDNNETKLYFHKYALFDYEFFKSKFSGRFTNANEVVLEYDAELLNTFLNIMYHKFRNIDNKIIDKQNCIMLYELSDCLRIDFIMIECTNVIFLMTLNEELLIFCFKFYNNFKNILIQKYKEVDSIYYDYLNQDQCKNFLLEFSQLKMSLKLAYLKYIRYLDSNDLGEDWTKNIKYEKDTYLYIISHIGKSIEPKHDNMIKICIEYLQKISSDTIIKKDKERSLKDLKITDVSVKVLKNCKTLSGINDEELNDYEKTLELNDNVDGKLN